MTLRDGNGKVLWTSISRAKGAHIRRESREGLDGWMRDDGNRTVQSIASWSYWSSWSYLMVEQFGVVLTALCHAFQSLSPWRLLLLFICALHTGTLLQGTSH